MIKGFCNGRKLFIVFNHPARFGGHRHCGSGDITDQNFHVTLFLIVCSYPAKFDTHRHCGSGYIMILDFNVIIWTCDYMGRNRSG